MIPAAPLLHLPAALAPGGPPALPPWARSVPHQQAVRDAVGVWAPVPLPAGPDELPPGALLDRGDGLLHRVGGLRRDAGDHEGAPPLPLQGTAIGVVREGDGLLLRVVPPHAAFHAAFDDGIGWAPRRGDAGGGWSTAGAVAALERFDAAGSGTDERAIAWGDETSLVRRGDVVVARSDYDLWDPEELPAALVRDALCAYRDALALGPGAGGPVTPPPAAP